MVSWYSRTFADSAVPVGVVPANAHASLVGMVIVRASAATIVTIAVGDVPVVAQLTAEAPEVVIAIPIPIVVHINQAVTATQTESATVTVAVQRFPSP